jgi:hypothetical protein
MSDLLEDRLRDELAAAAMAVVPPGELVREVGQRLQRRRQRRRNLAGVAVVLVCAVAGAAVLSSSPGHHSTSSPKHRTHHHHKTRLPQPPLPPAELVHGPPLLDTTTGAVFRAIRTIALPGGRSPINGMTVGDTFYGDATLYNGVDLGNFQRLVRVSRSGQVVIGPVAMRAPTTPVLGYGSVWVADRHRLIGYDPSTLVIRRVVRLPGDLPGEVAAAGGYLWIAGWAYLDRVDPGTGGLTRLPPDSDTERFAGAAANTAGQLFTASSHLPDIMANVDTIERRNPATGAVLATRTRLGLGATDLAGVAGRGLWLGDTEPGVSGHVDRVDTSSLAVQSPVAAGSSIDVTVSNGVPWVSAAALTGPGHAAAIFECLSPTTFVPLGQLSLRRYPGETAEQVPATAAVPEFFAAGPHVMFASVDRVLVIYPADPRCAA